MKINDYGQVEISAEEAFQSLYTAKIKNLDGVYIEDTAARDQFNLARGTNADRFGDLVKLVLPKETIAEFDQLNQQQWFMPEEYKNFNIVEFLLDKAQNEEQYQRVVKELELFVQHNMIDVLKYIKYLVDTMRKNNIVWGVGRGSSVASYVLYLIGIHKVDSLKFELDIHEFLK
jgi:DNA polymerase III alpha subunit